MIKHTGSGIYFQVHSMRLINFLRNRNFLSIPEWAVYRWKEGRKIRAIIQGGREC